MTLDVHPEGIPADRPDPERPADPRPAWERIAYTWLAREVDHGQPVDPATLAREVSVAPGLARDLLRLLRGQRDRDPGLLELRTRLVLPEYGLRWQVDLWRGHDRCASMTAKGVRPRMKSPWLRRRVL